MRIAFVVNPVHTYERDGWSPLDSMLSGTEESVVQWAEHMVKLGHIVDVYKNGPELAHNGVSYYDRDKYQGKCDVTVNVKSADISPVGPTAYFTNETNATSLDLSAFDCVIFPSVWAKKHIPVNNNIVHVVYHGYDPALVRAGVKVSNQVLYASSPDRGLATLLEVWPEVIRQVPLATLKVTYGADGPALPGVDYLGRVDETTMNRLYRESDIWCHPANGGELFGITGIKAQVSGCIPVYFPTMALAETVKEGVASSPELLAQDLIDLMVDDSAKLQHRLAMSLHSFPTWEDTTGDLLNVLNGIVEP